jgi:uncharacterized protein DUF5985
MTTREAVLFLWGASTLGSWVIALFFLKYWKRTRDRLFLFFSAAFWILSVNWIGLAVVNPSQESRHWIFVVRVIAFACILAGILAKNWPRSPRT